MNCRDGWMGCVYSCESYSRGYFAGREERVA
jgi:hypothetical protein